MKMSASMADPVEPSTTSGNSSRTSEAVHTQKAPSRFSGPPDAGTESASSAL